MDGQMAVAEGEYVWMPREQAQRYRAKSGDRDLGLWLLVALFALYFVWQMVPTIIHKHIGDDNALGSAERRLLTGPDTFKSSISSVKTFVAESISTLFHADAEFSSFQDVQASATVRNVVQGEASTLY